jgi:putative ABC transport system substrate-binding protein
MRRREFIAGLGGAAAWPVVAHAKNPIIGMLTTSSSGVIDAGFQQGLADFGYVPGQNISLIRKEAASDRLDQLAAELIAISPDVIFGTGSQTTIALKRQTNTIPIVTMSTNPLGLGFVASLARPGGNITGVSLLGPEVAGKRLELLKELVPGVDTAAVLWNWRVSS